MGNAAVGGLGRAWAVACLGAAVTGCAALDELAVGQTERLAEGQFYVDTVAGAPRTADGVIVLPVTLDPELADSLGCGDRAREFEPLLAALNASLQSAPCCQFITAPGLPPGAPHVYLGSAQGELAPPEVREQQLPGDCAALRRP